MNPLSTPRSVLVESNHEIASAYAEPLRARRRGEGQRRNVADDERRLFLPRNSLRPDLLPKSA
jgi:hypothetical protein